MSRPRSPAHRDIHSDMFSSRGGKLLLLVCFEIFRANAICNQVSAGMAAVKATYYAIPVAAPLVCGTMQGCGGGFLPASKGLDPVKAGLSRCQRQL